MTNRLSPLYEIKRASINPDGVFKGYASTFNGEPDAYGDIIIPGAFTKSVNTHIQRGTMPALLWSHDQQQVIGKWMGISEDAHGLAVEGKLTLGTEKGKEAYALMKDDALSLSIGFSINPDGVSEKGGNRYLKEIELHEISCVGIPANPNARITEVKSIREFETELRDALGFSTRQAKKLASGGWSALAGRDVHSEEITELVREIKNLTNEIRNFKR